MGPDREQTVSFDDFTFQSDGLHFFEKDIPGS